MRGRMLESLLNILGKSEARIPEGADVGFTFRHAPHSWMVFVLIGVVAGFLYGVWWLYRREIDSCSPRWKSLLAMLRSGIVLLAVLIFLGPMLTYSTQRIIQPYIMVLLDDSLSMAIRDRYREEARIEAVSEATGMGTEELTESPPTRAEIIDRLLRNDDHGFIRRLTTRGKVRVLSFSDRLRLRDTRGAEDPEVALRELEEAEETVELGDPVPPIEPEGKTTNIARAIREARRLAAGSPLAGIVLLTDGQNTAGGDPGTTAARAGDDDVPVFTSGIGDPGEPINIRVVDLWAPENVFRDDPMLIQVSIKSQGIEGEDATLELHVRDTGQSAAEDERGQMVAQKTVKLSAGLQTVSFEHNPQEAGTFLYSVTVTPREDELLDSDNNKSTVVNVLREQVRVLLVSGSPTWEYRLVKNLLIRDSTIDLSCWLQSMSHDMRQDGNTSIESLPRSRQELMEYDALLLFDPDPAEFNEKWIEEIKNFMENHAGGLLWMSGPQYSLQFLTHARTREIRDVLPVRLRGLEAGILDAMGTTKKREWPLKVPPESTDHPILQIRQDAQDTGRIWGDLPGVYWSFPTRGTKPGAQTLLEHTNPQLRTEQGAVPLLATGQYGPGRSVYVGFQSTWRWRRPGVRYFQKFWIQTVRYLVQGRLVRGRTRGRILTNRDVYAVGDRVTITAQLYDPAYRPLQRDTVTARVNGPRASEQEVQLRAVAQNPGEYEGSVVARQMGLNELEVVLERADGEPVRVQRQFTVEMPDVESANPRMNVSLLKDIAGRSGGAYFPLDKVNGVADAIPDRREMTVVHGRPIPLWDTSRMLIVLVVLFTLEWAFRKRFRLM